MGMVLKNVDQCLKLFLFSLGVWQFLVDLPFDVVSPDFVLRIVYLLMNIENVSPNDVFSISPDDMGAVVRGKANFSWF